MINNSEIDVDAVTRNSGIKLQTEVAETTKNYLRLEAVRRHLTMGQLIDELVALLRDSVSETTS